MQAVSAANRPSGHGTNDDLRHVANQSLTFKDVQSPGTRRIDFRAGSFGILIAILAADSLVTAGTKRPTSIFLRWSVTSQNDSADVARLASMIQSRVKFINGLRPERVSYFRAIERNSHRAGIFCAVIGNVGEAELIKRLPKIWIEDLRDFFCHMIC